jgi:hypothetical protein
LARATATFVALVLLTAAVGAPAARAIDYVALAPDVTVELGGLPYADESVAADNLAGLVVPVALGSLPGSAAISGYQPAANGDELFSLDMTVELPGPLTAEPRDVVRYSDGGYAIEFDGSASGVPAGAAIDAVGQTPAGDLLLSFDTTVSLGSVTADDEDVVRWDGASYSLAFDGSAQGVAEGLDLDGLHAAGGGVLVVSFDGSGSVGGVGFDNEDALVFYPAGPTWMMLYDGSAEHAALDAADVEAIAVPEPAENLLLATGIGFLLAVGRRRARG